MELAGEWALLKTESSGSDGRATSARAGRHAGGNCKGRDCKIKYGQMKYGNGPNIYKSPTGERHKREKEIFEEIIWIDFTQFKKKELP